jgi:hypothetical protein
MRTDDRSDVDRDTAATSRPAPLDIELVEARSAGTGQEGLSLQYPSTSTGGTARSLARIDGPGDGHDHPNATAKEVAKPELMTA